MNFKFLKRPRIFENKHPFKCFKNQSLDFYYTLVTFFKFDQFKIVKFYHVFHEFYDFHVLDMILRLKPVIFKFWTFSASDGVHQERRSVGGPPLRRHGACNYPPQNFVKQALTKYGSHSLKTLGEATILRQYTVAQKAERVAGRIHAGYSFLLHYACLVAASESHLIRPLMGLPLCFHYIRGNINKTLTKITFFEKNEFFFKNNLIRHFFEGRKKMPILKIIAVLYSAIHNKGDVK